MRDPLTARLSATLQLCHLACATPATQTRLYLEYLDRHGSLAQRFSDSGVPAWVVFGESDDVGITSEEGNVLETSPHVSIVEIPETGHFALNQKPGEIATIVLEAVKATAEHRRAPSPAS